MLDSTTKFWKDETNKWPRVNVIKAMLKDFYSDRDIFQHVAHSSGFNNTQEIYQVHAERIYERLFPTLDETITTEPPPERNLYMKYESTTTSHIIRNQ